MSRVAVLATAVVAAVVLALVLTRTDGGGSGKDGEVFLQAASKTGPDPFTESTATDSSAPPASSAPATESAAANAVRGVDGGAPGLYGGTRNVSSCDVEAQIKALQAAPAKNRAFASVAGVQPSGVPAYLRALTPVQLRMDTRVTNHGYRDGAATSYQAVLQAGTAVLVDDRGVPRVRCACGNPLAPPVAQQSTPKRTGDSWPSYRPSNVVVVSPSITVVNIFVLYDPDEDEWIARHRGDTGGNDRHTDPPVHPSPSVTMTTPTPTSTPPTTPTSPPTSPSTGPSSPKPCVSTETAPATGTPTDTPTGTPTDSATPCPPTSASPSSPTPSSAPVVPEPETEPGATTQEDTPEQDTSSGTSAPNASDVTSPPV